mgnify:CR=1 FL=1
MNINYIRYALEISRCGSINRAAKQLYISQSSLSRGIKELEEEIKDISKIENEKRLRSVQKEAEEKIDKKEKKFKKNEKSI